jgi:hypothetical protein
MLEGRMMKMITAISTKRAKNKACLTSIFVNKATIEMMEVNDFENNKQKRIGFRKKSALATAIFCN